MPVMGEKGKVKEPEREPSNGEKGEKTQQRNLAREKAPTRGRDSDDDSITSFSCPCFNTFIRLTHHSYIRRNHNPIKPLNFFKYEKIYILNCEQ